LQTARRDNLSMLVQLALSIALTVAVAARPACATSAFYFVLLLLSLQAYPARLRTAWETCLGKNMMLRAAGFVSAAALALDHMHSRDPPFTTYWQCDVMCSPPVWRAG
jgi:hypothetical protein